MSKDLQLHEFQKGIVEFMAQNPRCYIAAEPGLGKTSTTLTRLMGLKKKTLIIAPLRIAYAVWPGEQQKWNQFSTIKMTVLHGPEKEKRFLSNKYGVYVINPEGLKWLDMMIIRHKRFPWKVLVIDEAPRFKSPKTVRFKKLKKMLSRFEYVYLLAGNPIPNSYLDLWSQIYILDLGKRLFNTFYRFRSAYFHQVDRQGFVWAPFQDTPERIKDAVRDIVKYVKASDHIDLPERVYNDMKFELPQEVRKIYKDMQDKLFSDLDGGKITAANAAVASQKCQQIANGFIYETLDPVAKLAGEIAGAQRLHTIKLDMLGELVEELDGSPLLVGYWYQEDYKMLMERFPTAEHIGRGTTFDEGVEIEKRWNKRQIPLLFGQIGAVSHGLNLQEAGFHVFLYSLVYNYDQFDQFIRRVLRQGNEYDRVMVHRPIANDTVDLAMCKSLDTKGTRASDFLEALKLYRMEQ